MSHPNEELIRTAYDLFGKGDIETLQTLWTDDVTWSISGNSRTSGEHEGAAAIIAMFGELFTGTEGTFQVELQSAFANDHTGMSMHKATATKGGEDYELWTVLGYMFEAGKVSQLWSFPYDQHLEEKLLA